TVLASDPAMTAEDLTLVDGPGPRHSRGAARRSRYHRLTESKRPRLGVVFFVVIMKAGLAVLPIPRRDLQRIGMHQHLRLRIAAADCLFGCHAQVVSMRQRQFARQLQVQLDEPAGTRDARAKV